MTLRELVTRLGFTVDLRGLDAYDKTLERVENKLKDMSKGSVAMLDRMEKMGKALSMKLTLPIAALSTVSVMARVKQEQVIKQWDVMTGRGKEIFDNLRDLSEHTQFNHEEIDSYAKALFKLKVPINDIIPQLKRFSDIAAGTGQDAGQMMQEWAEARLNPMMRGRMLQRLMREGVVSEVELRQAGINPLLMKREGGLDRLGMASFDKIFGNLAQKNMGKAAELSETLGKNTERFWTSLTKVREAIGEVLERVFHLNAILKAGAKFFTWLADTIQKMPGWLKLIVVGVGAIAAAIGPLMLSIVAIGHVLLFAKLAMVGLKLAGFQTMAGILAGAGKVAMSIAAITGQILIAVAAALALIYILREVNIASKKAQVQGQYEKSLTETKPGAVNLLTGKGAITKFIPHAMTAEQRRMADFANGVKSSATETKPGAVNPLTGKGAITKFIPHAMTAEQRRMADFANGVKSSASKATGATIHNTMTVQVTVPPGTTASQIATLKAGAEAAHKPILDAMKKSLILDLQKAYR